mmetsp:Transcript_75724/g.222024  ORF Transcript_75724/g.222024 Transcript_75724/m.222024 type:complete len:158 (-) Transcript_75724:1363-1836(-)
MMMSQSRIVERRCAIANDVLPSRAASRAVCTTRSLLLSRALVASSRSSTGGSRTRARQMATRCFWPPESLEPLSPTCVCHPSALPASMKPMWDITLHSSKRSSVMKSSSCKPYMTFSKTVPSKSTGSWPTKATRLLHQRMLRLSSGTWPFPIKTEPR